MDEHVQTHVIYWLRFIISRFDCPNVVIVGTKQDLVVETALVSSVETDIRNRLDRWKQAVDDELESHQSRPSDWSENVASAPTNPRMVPLERLELQKKWLDDTSYREWVTVSIRSPDSVLSMREKVRETVFRHNLLRSFEQELPNEVYRSSWKEVADKDILHALKASTETLHFVYTQAAARSSLSDASLIVPTRWRLDDEKQLDLSARHAPLVEWMPLSVDTSTSLHKAGWEYEFSTMLLPRTVFKFAAVRCYDRKLHLRVHENDVLGYVNDQSVFRIALFFHPGVRLSRGFDKVKWKKLFVEWELVSKSSRKKNLSYRRAIVALDEDGKPDWSTHVIRLSPAPAIKNLREWSLQVTLRRNSVFQFGHVARGVQALDVLQVSEDFSTFSSANVDIQLRSRKDNREVGHVEIIRFLMDNNGRKTVQIPDNAGNTPLHAACLNHQFEVAQLLIERGGADVSVENEGRLHEYLIRPTSSVLGGSNGGDNTFHQVMLWDFAGQDIYKPAHAPFFSEKTLFLLCIDLYDYASKIKQANTFRAIQCEKILWQYAEANRDLVKDHDVEEVKKNAKATIGKWKSAFSKQLDVELARLREEKLDEKAVESTYDDAINGAVQEIEEIVSSSKLGDVMSPKCRDALTKVYERRQDAKGKKGAEWLETLMMPPKDLGDPESVKFLHDLGDVLWFKDESSGMLEDFVILEPKLVIDFIRQVAFMSRISIPMDKALQIRGRVVRFEVVAFEVREAWVKMRFFICAMERVLEKYPGVKVDRYVAELPLTTKPKLQTTKLVDGRTTYDETKLTWLAPCTIGIDCDLSGVCYHKESPIEIRVSGGLLSQYGKYLQVGLSIVSNIVPTAMDLGLLKAAVDHAKEVIAQRTDEAIKVRSLLANFDFVEHTGDTHVLSSTSANSSENSTVSEASGLDAVEAAGLLEAILKCHDPNFEAHQIGGLCGLSPGVSRDGVSIWASKKELEEHDTVLEQFNAVVKPSKSPASSVAGSPRGNQQATTKPTDGFFVEVKVISVSQEMKVKNDRLELKFQFVGKNGQSEVTVNPPTDGRNLDWSTAAVNSKTMESITSIRECLLVAWAGRRRWFPFLKPHVFLNATCELGVYFPAGSGPGTTASWSPSNNFKFELTLRQKDRAP
ncbi:hypothetical protein P43SY_005115 [Pythium insidiosum]|uniref:Uncharacterized protein n=1 Tax=Pythium insidiosum TaxID=114742 RepID=A0AAD5Q5U6_PYTIN|nr:hypothetical protein P43SY_005115 [Pythium insidiosum]